MLDEKQIIDRLKNGDSQALKLLMELHQDYIYTLVIQMVKSVHASEELTQDIFIKVYNKINTYEERSKFTTWLYTITYRTCLNYLEKKKIVFSETDLMSTDEREAKNIESYSNLSQREEWGDATDTEEKQKILWDAIDILPSVQGVIITLHYLQQFSIREIADMIQLPLNTIKTHLHRGRNTMRSILLKRFSEEELS